MPPEKIRSACPVFCGNKVLDIFQKNSTIQLLNGIQKSGVNAPETLKQINKEATHGETRYTLAGRAGNR
jgi:hypothetical protein